jgi:hypothetical protein
LSNRFYWRFLFRPTGGDALVAPFPAGSMANTHQRPVVRSLSGQRIANDAGFLSNHIRINPSEANR